MLQELTKRYFKGFPCRGPSPYLKRAQFILVRHPFSDWEGCLTTLSSFNLTPEQLVIFHECLGSKVCIRIFQVFLSNKSLNVSAISRKVGCNNDRCIEHLKKLAKLGIVQEEFYAGRHSFVLKKGDFMDLMQQAISIMSKDEESKISTQ